MAIHFHNWDREINNHKSDKKDLYKQMKIRYNSDRSNLEILWRLAKSLMLLCKLAEGERERENHQAKESVDW